MNRRLFWFLLIPFLLLSVLPAPARAQDRAKAPKLTVENGDYNFGRVYQGQKVEHAFHFRNSGDAPLSILKVRSSCGCTAALVSAVSLDPGEEGQVQTTFDSTRFRGQVVKVIYLYSNDPVHRVVQFTLHGVVKPELVTDPEQIDFGILNSGEEKDVRLKLTNQGEEEIDFPKVETTTPELEASLTASKLAPGKSGEITVRAIPREGKGMLSGYILIDTNDPRVPQLRIPVFARYAQAPPPQSQPQ